MPSNVNQTIALDAYPDLPLDEFPDAMLRIPLAKVGLDGIDDNMQRTLVGEAYTEQDRADGVWTRVS
jgi:ABC-type thiamine transport system ATPase subunit